MKRLALLAAGGLISMLPAMASARPHFFFFAPRVPAPVFVAPAPVFVVPASVVVVVPAPVVCDPAPVVVAPAPVIVHDHWYHFGFYHRWW